MAVGAQTIWTEYARGRLRFLRRRSCLREATSGSEFVSIGPIGGGGKSADLCNHLPSLTYTNVVDKTIKIEHGHVGVPDVSVRADARSWLRVLHKETSMLRQIVLRRIRVKGPLNLFKAFGRCFA